MPVGKHQERNRWPGTTGHALRTCFTRRELNAPIGIKLTTVLSMYRLLTYLVLAGNILNIMQQGDVKYVMS